jgi:hypothetical protein
MTGAPESVLTGRALYTRRELKTRIFFRAGLAHDNRRGFGSLRRGGRPQRPARRRANPLSVSATTGRGEARRRAGRGTG